MTKREHIQYWLNQIPEDIDVVTVLFNTKHYAHSLFWAHLVLEKLLKALWVQNNTENIPPFIHNLLKLSKTSNFIPTEEQIVFMQIMNDYNHKFCYKENMLKIAFTTTQESTTELIEKYNELVICIQKQIL